MYLAVIVERGEGCDYLVGCGILVIYSKDGEDIRAFSQRIRDGYVNDYLDEYDEPPQPYHISIYKVELLEVYT